jgi:hypothetical protein
MKTQKPKLDPTVRKRLEEGSLCDTDTVKRWWRGERVQRATHVRLLRAVELLGVDAPETPRRTG